MISPGRGDSSTRTQVAEFIWRVWLEPEFDFNILLSPCRCNGNQKYIHEECLKTWLISMQSELMESRCEQCKTEIAMNYKIETQCSPKYVFRQGQNNCMYLPLLAAVVWMISLVLFLLFEEYQSNPEVINQDGYIITFISTCTVSFIVFTILIVQTIRDSCYIRKLVEWNIQSKVAKHTHSMDSSMTHLQNDDPAHETKELPNVLVMPRRIKINGRFVELPNLNPGLERLIDKKGQTIGFYTKNPQTYREMSERRIPMQNSPKRKRRNTDRNSRYSSFTDDVASVQNI